MTGIRQTMDNGRAGHVTQLAYLDSILSVTRLGEKVDPTGEAYHGLVI